MTGYLSAGSHMLTSDGCIGVTAKLRTSSCMAKTKVRAGMTKILSASAHGVWRIGKSLISLFSASPIQLPTEAARQATPYNFAPYAAKIAVCCGGGDPLCA